MRSILHLLLQLTAICVLLYLIIGLCIAAIYITVIDQTSIIELSTIAAIVLTWPALIAMAIIFWFAAG